MTSMSKSSSLTVCSPSDRVLSPRDRRLPPIGNSFKNFAEPCSPQFPRTPGGPLTLPRRRSWSGYCPFDLSEGLGNSCGSTSLGDSREQAPDERDDCPDTDSEFGFCSTLGESLGEVPLPLEGAAAPAGAPAPAAQPCSAGGAPRPVGPQPKGALPQVVMMLPMTLPLPSQPVGEGPAVTTLMLRNLPKQLKQSELLQELDGSGFAGLYDFCYMPRCFQTGKSQGFAFVNFDSPAIAGAFIGAWQRQRRLGVGPSESPLAISSAKLQGLAKNLSKWDTPRLRRIRNPEFHPFVRGGHALPEQEAPRVPVRTGPAGMALPPNERPGKGRK